MFDKTNFFIVVCSIIAFGIPAKRNILFRLNNNRIPVRQLADVIRLKYSRIVLPAIEMRITQL